MILKLSHLGVLPRLLATFLCTALAAVLVTFSAAADPCDDAPATYCDTAQNENLLSRLGFGGDPWSRERIQTLGSFFYLREQLTPESIPDPEFEQALSAYATGPYSTWGKSIETLRSQFCAASVGYCTDRRGPVPHINFQLAEIKQLRATLSRRQLEAVLLDFWLNHFNVDGDNGIPRWTMQSYEMDSLAPHALGRFEDLLREASLAPAMLDYLDLKRSRRGNLNENFARELLELHTVGKVDTYDEEDVQEVTKILTGYVSNSPSFATQYIPNRHVNDTKTVTLENTPAWVFDGSLGCDGRPADAFATEAEVLFCLLALHPKTAEFVSRKLIARFVTGAPRQELVDRAVGAWLANGGNLRGVMLAILSSKDFLGFSELYNTKFARPSVFTAHLARAVGPDVLGASAIVDQPSSGARVEASLSGIMGDITLMGEELYKAGPPTGYPESSVAWASAGGTLVRLDQVQRLVTPITNTAARFGVPPTGGSAVIVDALAERFVPEGLRGETRASIIDFLNNLPTSVGRNQRVRQAVILMLSSPDFLMH